MRPVPRGGTPARRRPAGSRQAGDGTTDAAQAQEGLPSLAGLAWARCPAMSEYLAEIMTTVQAPDHREPDSRTGRERYFGRGGPFGWIRVVSEFAGENDRVVTAFPQSNDPREGAWRR